LASFSRSPVTTGRSLAHAIWLMRLTQSSKRSTPRNWTILSMTKRGNQHRGNDWKR